MTPLMFAAFYPDLRKPDIVELALDGQDALENS